MSTKTIIVFSLWTSFWSAVFYHFYNMFFDFGIPWIMFICLGIYFAMGLKPRQSPGLLLSAYCGLLWGQVDFLLIFLFGTVMGMSTAAASFAAIILGTAVSMYIHLKPLSKTPLRHMPIIFAGVCLTFSQGGKNVPGLFVTFFCGILLAAICSAGQLYLMKKFPLEEKSQDGNVSSN